MTPWTNNRKKKNSNMADFISRTHRYRLGTDTLRKLNQHTQEQVKDSKILNKSDEN